eukprot:1344693-Prymnesium_polylepis.1
MSRTYVIRAVHPRRFHCAWIDKHARSPSALELKSVLAKAAAALDAMEGSMATHPITGRLVSALRRLALQGALNVLGATTQSGCDGSFGRCASIRTNRPSLRTAFCNRLISTAFTMSGIAVGHLCSAALGKGSSSLIFSSFSSNVAVFPAAIS